MQHSIIVRIAWGLAVFLLVVSAAFAWSANQRERHYAELAAAARQAAAGGANATPSEVGAITAAAPPTVTAEQVQALFASRCAKCHEPEEVPEWVAARAADEREVALFEFLQAHRKAKTNADENHILAAYFAAGGGV